MDACADPNGFGCAGRMATSRSTEAAPASSRSSAATARPRPGTAAKKEEHSTPAPRERPQLAEKKPASTVAEAKVGSPASGRPAETPDPVIVKAKAAIAAKLENPASAEFGEMNRAIRKNMLGNSIDTICGRVKGKKASGEDAGEWPFLYLVTEDEAYVVNGPTNSAAASAYHNICS